jgi:rare lipoprotein A (peptidoglycan hydrolase)
LVRPIEALNAGGVMRKVAAALFLCALSVPSWASAHEAKSPHKINHIHKAAVHHKSSVHVATVPLHVARDPNASHGIASVYARSLVGRRTANGERLDFDHLTAASLALPLGTIVSVTNRRNGKQAMIRVNDRGPYTGGFLIDLSPAAAAALGMGRTGTIPVDIRVAAR